MVTRVHTHTHTLNKASTHARAQSFLLALKHFFGSDVLSLILSTRKMCAAGGGEGRDGSEGGGGVERVRQSGREMTHKPAPFC